MRPYRGKPIDKKYGEWVYGWLRKIPRYRRIVYVIYPFVSYGNDYIEVIPETVGQSTGIRDKNGKEIYEGDIVKCGCVGEFVVKWSGFYKRVMCVSHPNAGTVNGTPFFHSLETNSVCEVIGTIHDKEKDNANS